MFKKDRTEEIYPFIWSYVTLHEALPKAEIGDCMLALESTGARCCRRLTRNGGASMCVSSAAI